MEMEGEAGAQDVVAQQIHPDAEDIDEYLAKDGYAAFEKALYSYDYDHRKYGYKNLIDVDSFVDYFLINEFTCNYDAGSQKRTFGA